MNTAARAELALDLVLPFLGLFAVFHAAPEQLTLLVLTGWLVVVLDAYLATLISRSRDDRARWRRLAAPALVLASELSGGTPAFTDWAIQSAMCGMTARALALAAAMVEKAAGTVRAGGGIDDFSIAIPGFLFIVGAGGATLYTLGQAWWAVHGSDAVATATLAIALATAGAEDLSRIRRLSEAKPSEDLAEALILPLLGAWALLGAGLLVWQAWH